MKSQVPHGGCRILARRETVTYSDNCEVNHFVKFPCCLQSEAGPSRVVSRPFMMNNFQQVPTGVASREDIRGPRDSPQSVKCRRSEACASQARRVGARTPPPSCRPREGQACSRRASLSRTPPSGGPARGAPGFTEVPQAVLMRRCTGSSDLCGPSSLRCIRLDWERCVVAGLGPGDAAA